MRHSEVRAAIVAIVSGLTRDTDGGEGDRLVHVTSHGGDPETAPSGAFRVALATQPQRHELTTYDSWIVEHQLTIYHPHSPDIEDRIGALSERLDIALERAHETYAEINTCTCEPAGVDDLTHLVASRYSVVTHYRLTASLL